MAITAGQDILASDFVSAASGAADSGKVAKLDANGKIIDGFLYKQYVGMTASGAIAVNDVVYLTAANTVKTLYPSDMGTPAAVTTATTTALQTKTLPLSTLGRYLHVTGGYDNASGQLVAQVRTMNAGETDFSNGSEATIYSTGDGTRYYDVCPIGGDKFLLIWQAVTASAAAGVKAAVISISGTTVTVGSVVTIETTGTLACLAACAKVDTDKALIFYNKDSDGDMYTQVLTVSGTTITTNTPVLVKAMNGSGKASADQLTTNSVVVIYLDAAAATLYKGRTVTVSGTTPTLGAEQSLFTLSGAGSPNLFKVKTISTTKAFMLNSDNGSSSNDTCRNIAISGATMTASSTLALSAARSTVYCSPVTILEKYMLVADKASATSMVLFMLDVSGTAPTSVTTQTVSPNSVTTDTCSVVKVAPWTYYLCNGGTTAGRYIVKLTPSSSNHIGICTSAIADAATGTVSHRYKTHTLTGITLTAAVKYYVDETGQPTSSYSLTAPVLGIAINTTDLLVQ